jgi:hypothetical protein
LIRPPLDSSAASVRSAGAGVRSAARLLLSGGASVFRFVASGLSSAANGAKKTITRPKPMAVEERMAAVEAEALNDA